MSIFSIYFSPTNSTEKVVKVIADRFGKNEEIDLSKTTTYSHKAFDQEDICIIGVPSYGGRVPAVALERMKEYQGNGAKAVIVTVYGNRAYDDTLRELQDFVIERGFICIGGIAAVAEHSIMHQFASGRPDQKDVEELKSFADQIIEKIEEGRVQEEVKVPGNKPYREYKGIPLKPKAGNKCIKCGLCARMCPVEAIPLSNPKLTDKNRCISCMRCISLCPCHARKVQPLLVKAASLSMKKACSDRKENQLFL